MALSKLESMPTEIHFAILEHLLDLSTLLALLRASPMFYRAYSVHLENILTKLTLRELIKRVKGDIVPRLPCYWELGLLGTHINPRLKPAIISLTEQATTCDAVDIRLPLEHCIALLGIWAMHRWTVDEQGEDWWCTCPPRTTEFCFGISCWGKGNGIVLHANEVKDHKGRGITQWCVDWSATLEMIRLV